MRYLERNRDLNLVIERSGGSSKLPGRLRETPAAEVWAVESDRNRLLARLAFADEDSADPKESLAAPKWGWGSSALGAASPASGSASLYARLAWSKPRGGITIYRRRLSCSERDVASFTAAKDPIGDTVNSLHMIGGNRD